MRRRRLPALATGSARLQRRLSRPEDLQRRRDPVEIPLRRGHAAPAGRRLPTSRPVSSRRWSRPPAGALRVASIYLPNGNPVDSEKYPYKMKWMDRLYDYASERLKLEEALILAGDYNVIPAPADVHNPAAWIDDALFRPQTREKFRALTNLGLTDALRASSDRARALHLLGLSGRRLAEEQRHSHRPHPAVAAGGRPAHWRRHRQACARLGKAVGPRAGLRRYGLSPGARGLRPPPR